MIVVDATVVVKLVTREPGAEGALARIVKEDDRLAPDWIRIEVGNALAKKMRRDGLPEVAGRAGLAAIDGFVTETTDALDLFDEAFDLAIRLKHELYDCLYLALAVRHQVILVTHDEKFAHAATRAGLGGHMELLT